jgi:hypothetical protein
MLTEKPGQQRDSLHSAKSAKLARNRCESGVRVIAAKRLSTTRAPDWAYPLIPLGPPRIRRRLFFSSGDFVLRPDRVPISDRE